MSLIADEEILRFSNFDLENLVTLVKADVFEELLLNTGYDQGKTEFVINRFRNGFSLGYCGDFNVKINSPNLKLHIGSETILWNKMMKEVKEKHFAGPFDSIPFDNYIQSLVGLVPKDNRANTRLIFHLSYPKNGTTSVNASTPKHLCMVKYLDFNQAVRRCIEEGKCCFCGKSDVQAAFRNLPISSIYWKFLIMKAQDPISKEWKFFVDKCLPFGSSISCAHFQVVSDAIAHVVKIRSGGKIPVNYLDDYFFSALLKILCNSQVQEFIQACKEIAFPVNLDKTVWATTMVTFLGFLIDTVNQVIAIPKEKIDKAIDMINYIVFVKKGKVTVHHIQKLCGYLNFLCRCIIPGRPFTNHLYSLTVGKTIGPRQYHHINITQEAKLDLKVWLMFLQTPEAYY